MGPQARCSHLWAAFFLIRYISDWIGLNFDNNWHSLFRLNVLVCSGLILFGHAFFGVRSNCERNSVVGGMAKIYGRKLGMLERKCVSELVEIAVSSMKKIIEWEFSPLHPYTHRTQRLVWVPWCDSRNRLRVKDEKKCSVYLHNQRRLGFSTLLVLVSQLVISREMWIEKRWFIVFAWPHGSCKCFFF